MAATCFGILLSGGSSTRMGRDKATLETGEGTTLARRCASALTAHLTAAVEVGPGASGLPAITETPPGNGPLAAVVTGWRHLVGENGDKRPAVVLACDLPEVPAEMVAWLAAYPGDQSVVPVVAGHVQPLCARWSVADLERAASQLSGGERSLRDVFGPGAAFAREEEWRDVASAGELADVDTPDDLARRGIAPPETGNDWVGLSRTPLAVERAVRWATLASTGAVVTFTGVVRDHAEGRAGVDLLAYEAYEGPALDRMRAVLRDARTRWPGVERACVLHRLGALGIGDAAVCVVVSAAHRHDAFSAGEHVIDTVKETVPIWKYERWRDGEGWGTGATPVRSV